MIFGVVVIVFCNRITGIVRKGKKNRGQMLDFIPEWTIGAHNPIFALLSQAASSLSMCLAKLRKLIASTRHSFESIASSRPLTRRKSGATPDYHIFPRLLTLPQKMSSFFTHCKTARNKKTSLNNERKRERLTNQLIEWPDKRFLCCWWKAGRQARLDKSHHESGAGLGTQL